MDVCTCAAELHSVFDVAALSSSQYQQALRRILEDGEEQDAALIQFALPLTTFMSDRFKAVWMLCQLGYLWDAEIIMRSALEACMKVCFVCFCDEDERKARITEYWYLNSVNNARKQASRAEACLKIRPDDVEIPDEIRRGEEKVFDGIKKVSDWTLGNRPAMNRKERRTLAQKWSLSEIIRALDGYLAAREVGPAFSALLHAYGISSHVAHADEAGMGLIADHATRPVEERGTLIKGHICRLLSDISSYYGFAGLALCVALKLKPKQCLCDARAAFERLLAAIQPVQRDFYRSQYAFYDKLGAAD